MRCRFDPARIERCLVCAKKCPEFLGWHHENKQFYRDLVDNYVTRFPDKYEKEYLIMPRKNQADLSNTDRPKSKMVAVVDKDNNILRIVPKDTLTGKADLDSIQDHRLIELTGKEYEVIVSIALKQKDLVEAAAPARKGK